VQLAIVSRARSDSGSDIVGSEQAVLDATAQHEQPTVLTGIERVWDARPWAPAEAVGLVMVGGSEAVE
jgi:hypothetical protein